MTTGKDRTRVVIMGAAGRDFHNFNVVYRDDPDTEVVAFTAAQIPGIAGRMYPPVLAGPYYPRGIPIVPEAELATLCRERRVHRVVFAYSDLRHVEVMHRASIALAAGADFALLGPHSTMLESRVPVIAVCAVRTGCGKSQTVRWIARLLRKHGLRAAVLRHPMPYGDLAEQAVQRFATPADLDAAHCTIEEREDYEPHLAQGSVVYAGVDYAEITKRAEAESDMILWDGGNNDFPFLRPGLFIALADALRPGHETTHHPGEAVLRMADAIVLAKCDAAAPGDVERLRESVRRANPSAAIVRGGSPVTLDDAEAVHGKRVLVIEDGPTITHGGVAHGAGLAAARQAGAGEIVDPRASAAQAIAAVYAQYPHIGPVLPAVGYQPEQLAALEQTIRASRAEVVISATPADLARLIRFDRPVVRVQYEFADLDSPGLGGIVESFLREAFPGRF